MFNIKANLTSVILTLISSSLTQFTYPLVVVHVQIICVFVMRVVCLSLSASCLCDVCMSLSASCLTKVCQRENTKKCNRQEWLEPLFVDWWPESLDNPVLYWAFGLYKPIVNFYLKYKFVILIVKCFWLLLMLFMCACPCDVCMSVSSMFN